jgi:hypothetical protein
MTAINYFGSVGITVYLITVAAQAKAWTIFARSNTGIMGSNPTQDMDVCVRLFCLHAVVCVQTAALQMADPPSGFLTTMYKIMKLKERPRPNKGL